MVELILEILIWRVKIKRKMVILSLFHFKLPLESHVAVLSVLHKLYRLMIPTFL